MPAAYGLGIVYQPSAANMPRCVSRTPALTGRGGRAFREIFPDLRDQSSNAFPQSLTLPLERTDERRLPKTRGGASGSARPQQRAGEGLPKTRGDVSRSARPQQRAGGGLPKTRGGVSRSARPQQRAGGAQQCAGGGISPLIECLHGVEQRTRRHVKYPAAQTKPRQALAGENANQRQGPSHLVCLGLFGLTMLRENGYSSGIAVIEKSIEKPCVDCCKGASKLAVCPID